MVELQLQPPSQAEVLAILEAVLPSYRDPAQLAASPLARWQVAYRAPGHQAGNRVQAVLGAALDTLRPASLAAAESPQGRSYLLLDALYRQGLSPKEIYEGVLRLSKSQFYRERQRAMQSLANVLYQQEKAAAEIWQQALPPPTYGRLFGAEALVAGLLERMADQEGSGLIVLDGMGGIGKTAIGREAALWALREGMFAALVWQTVARASFSSSGTQPDARPVLTPEALLDGIAQGLSATQWANLPTPEKLAAITRRLAEHPTLLVVDNVETVADGRALLDILQQLARIAGTRILLTSRYRLDNFEPLASVHLHPLGPADTLAFLRHHAAEHELPTLAEAPDALLQPVYAASGGHPLAIKLLVGLANAQEWEQVLLGLEHPAGAGEQFYKFIYRHLWELLSDGARQVLLSLPHLAPAGAVWDELLAVSGLPAENLPVAVSELLRFSLVDQLYAGIGLEPRYSLHPLTRQFIVSDLLGHWPAPGI